jgi:hypothetical protein
MADGIGLWQKLERPFLLSLNLAQIPDAEVEEFTTNMLSPY